MMINRSHEDLYKRLVQVMPGGHSNLRVPLIDRPLFLERGKGSHVWDLDGKEYIEYWNGAGPGILGYGNEEYVNALKNQLDKLLYVFSGVGLTTLDMAVAEKIVNHVPCAEKVRFTTTGTEAVQLAIRLARAYTKRPFFVRFEGHYHGWMDNVLGGVVRKDPDEEPFPMESDNDPLGTEGRSQEAFRQGFLLPWNDIEVLENMLERFGERIAMVLMEPILCNGGGCPPRPGYLERVRELCNKYAIILCFDEVITGFRVGLGGAQKPLGITPDLATFGKAMASGMPIGAVAGKEEIMDQLLERKVIGAGTFNGHPLSIAASLATINILEKNDGAVYKHIEVVQKKLGDGLREITLRHGFPALIQGPRGALFHHFMDGEVVYSAEKLHMGADNESYTKFLSRIIDEGVLVLMGGRWYISAALTEEDVDETLNRADRAMAGM
jgi:glutamate-1-semialdehyde 2,1-aminomutase